MMKNSEIFVNTGIGLIKNAFTNGIHYSIGTYKISVSPQVLIILVVLLVLILGLNLPFKNILTTIVILVFIANLFGLQGLTRKAFVAVVNWESSTAISLFDKISAIL